MSKILQPFLISIRSISRRRPPPGKPPILPPAKGKLYRVVHVPWQNFEDVQELLWRRHAYYDAFASIRAHFKQELSSTVVTKREDTKLDVDELAEQLKENEIENERVAFSRQSIIDGNAPIYEDTLLDAADHYSKLKNLTEDAQNDFIEDLNAHSTDFITVENMEAKIIEALENPINSEFAVDLDANALTSNYFDKFIDGTLTANDRDTVTIETIPLRQIGQFDKNGEFIPKELADSENLKENVSSSN